jgi:choice-of-anchor A domain-containing protein
MSAKLGKCAQIALCASALFSLQQLASAATVDSALDVLGSYNLFVSGDIGTSTSAYTSDSQGAMVVGGNAYLTTFANASNSTVNGYGLIVGNTLNFTGGSLGGNTYVGGSATLVQVNTQSITTAGSLSANNLYVAGNTVVGGALSASQVWFNGNVGALGGAQLGYSGVGGNLSAGTAASLGGTVSLNQSVVVGTVNIGSGGSLTTNGSSSVGGVSTSNAALPSSGATASPLNISATWSNLTQESQSLGSRTQTSGASVVSQYGGLFLNGSNTKLDVFDITSAQLSNINDFTLTAPSGATVIINVSGNSVTWTNSGFALNGVTANDVLFNFTDAKSIILSGIGVDASILAPNATINGGYGQLDGSIVAAAITGHLQLNSNEFTGTVSAVPLPGAGLLFGSALAGFGAFRARRRSAKSR